VERLFINNEFVGSASGKTFPVIDPSNCEKVVDMQEGDKADIDLAVEASKKAFYGGWQKSNGSERGKLLWKLADLMERDLTFLAKLESLDNGKTLKDSSTVDLPLAIACIRYYAGFADKIEGAVQQDDPDYMMFTVHQPYGIAGCIIPWNFPILMLSWKLGPALATGNVVTVKTSEKTPLAAIQITALIKEAGFPPGVVNIISGFGHTAGAALVAHPEVVKVAFTGSTRTGRLLMEMAAKSNLKKVSLELGGKSPAIVFEKADIAKAVQACFVGIFFNHGQVCCASSRVYVQESIYDEFLAAYKAAASSVKLGHQFDPETNQGPQVDEIQHKSILSYIEEGVKEGGKIECGGRAPPGMMGYFIEPTIISGLADNARCMKEEIFGPVVAISKFKTEEEALRRANDTQYGLAASIFTEDLSQAIRASRQVNAGVVWIK
jgi:aldehyde dehydrogenase (NAD+)